MWPLRFCEAIKYWFAGWQTFPNIETDITNGALIISTQKDQIMARIKISKDIENLKKINKTFGRP